MTPSPFPVTTERISAIESLLNVTEIEHQLHSINESLVREGVTIGPVFSTMRDLVLKHGRSFVSKPLPKGRWQGGLGACYGNALKAAKTGRYVYVEGYATSNLGGRTALLHAWVTDPQNPTVAYDPTWGDGREYFGIPFRLEYVLKMDEALGHPGLIDAWEAGWPLVSGKHRIEDVMWRPGTRGIGPSGLREG